MIAPRSSKPLSADVISPWLQAAAGRGVEQTSREIRVAFGLGCCGHISTTAMIEVVGSPIRGLAIVRGGVPFDVLDRNGKRDTVHVLQPDGTMYRMRRSKWTRQVVDFVVQEWQAQQVEENNTAAPEESPKNCGTCRFGLFVNNEGVGECRRYAPEVGEDGMACYPFVYLDGWCGDLRSGRGSSDA